MSVRFDTVLTGTAAELGTVAPVPTNKGTTFIVTDATSGTDCSTTGGGTSRAWCVSTGAAWTAESFGGGGTSGPDYDPDVPPTTGLNASASDEFTGGTTAAYQWGNQGTATLTAEVNSVRIHTASSAASDTKVIWYPAPAGDFFLATKMSQANLAGTTWANHYASGLAIMETGSVATPTSITGIYAQYEAAGAGPLYAVSRVLTGYTLVGTSDIGVGAAYIVNGATTLPWILGRSFYLGARYVSSTKKIYCYISYNGVDWIYYPAATRDLAAAPLYVGLFCDQNTAASDSDTRFYFIRTNTGVAGNAFPYPIGRAT